MVSKRKHEAPKTEEPGGEKRYRVLRLEADPGNHTPDQGYGIIDLNNRHMHSMLVAKGFNTSEEASAFLNQHLTPTMGPNQKLKTMNEISAADAAKLFHAARDLDDYDPLEPYGLRPEYFPHDIGARDFLQCLELYSKMVSEGSQYPFASQTPSTTSYTVEHRHISDEQRAALAEIASTISDADLDKRLPAGSREREVFDVLRENPGNSNKEIGEKLGIGESTVKTYLLRIYETLQLEGGRREVWAKYPPRKT